MFWEVSVHYEDVYLAHVLHEDAAAAVHPAVRGRDHLVAGAAALRLVVAAVAVAVLETIVVLLLLTAKMHHLIELGQKNADQVVLTRARAVLGTATEWSSSSWLSILIC
ncbi:hypothetical protein Y032_0040g288 [Ancylostoma ceylanicum]|nr:hypothetical protein Y032_0040g288 [Ancylostoma ceylanicum]